jgi:ABC-2 type transport system permease protein
VVLLLVGVGMFNAHIYGDYASIVAICIMGALIFLALGFFIASVTKTNNAATGMATSISIVMMFLSGVFFPINNLPAWAYNIVRWLPLSPMIAAMRNVALNNETLASQWQNLLLMAVWFVVAILVTSFTFKFAAE